MKDVVQERRRRHHVRTDLSVPESWHESTLHIAHSSKRLLGEEAILRDPPFLRCTYARLPYSQEEEEFDGNLGYSGSATVSSQLKVLAKLEPPGAFVLQVSQDRTSQYRCGKE